MKRTKGMGPSRAISDAMAATSCGWPVLTKNSGKDHNDRDTPIPWVALVPIRIGTVQKWRRVASKSALSQGGIRKKPRQCLLRCFVSTVTTSPSVLRPELVSFLARQSETANTRRCLADARRRSTSTVPAPQQFTTRLTAFLPRKEESEPRVG